MAIRKNPELYELNCQEVGKRLRMCRMSCEMSQAEAAKHLGHENATQISLWEGGDRMPTLSDLISLAMLYKTPTDFIIGLINDPVADPRENRFALGAKAVSDTIKSNFLKFCDMVGEATAMTLDQRDEDRKDVKAIADMAVEAKRLLKRVIELNPEFEEDWRGSSNLKTVIEQIIGRGEEAQRRITEEQRRFEVIDREMSFKGKTDANQQYFFPLVQEE
jgi:transcriptional regulator with XRE-family HTH domain